MKKSTLTPFLRNDLDILFIGLNPATGSSNNGHYFSVNQSFWNQLFDADLITQRVDKSIADDLVFGHNKVNFNNWSYGITDLLTEIAESDSRKVKPTKKNCADLVNSIRASSPKTAILLHTKVLNALLSFLGYQVPRSNTGQLGQLVTGCPTTFFNIAFPHGNTIRTIDKVERYKEVKNFLLKSSRS